MYIVYSWNLFMRSGAAIPRAIAKTAVAKLRMRMAGSREGEEMESTRKRSPSTTATALKAYTTGLLTMKRKTGVYLNFFLRLCELPV